MTILRTSLGILALLTGLGMLPAEAGTLVGHVRDPNWFAQRDGQPFGVGYYEYAVNANADGGHAPGGHDDTDVFGAFRMEGLPDGRYTVASWDVWWRSTFAFDVDVSGRGTTDDVDLRLAATMWGYPAFWHDQAYVEHGQTFEATGPVTMIYLRNPLKNAAYRVTLHEDGPGGAPVGVVRTFSGQGDHRLIYGYGDMPTEAGRIYYVAVRSTSQRVPGVLRRMEPRPDGSDPMPGGCLWQIFGVDECILTPEETPTPHVFIHREETHLELQWLDPAWSLQRSDSLPGDWISGDAVTSPVRVTPSEPNRIFRLWSE